MKQTPSNAIPINKTRVVRIQHEDELPDVYGSTPNGTIYSTTPGGSRIVYDRSMLMTLSRSPISRTPPKNIPEGLLRDRAASEDKKVNA